MVGLGTQDSAEEAVEFVASTGTLSFPMFWDETFVTWQVFGVGAQPAAALLAPDGELLGGWLGQFPVDEVLELARASAS